MLSSGLGWLIMRQLWQASEKQHICPSGCKKKKDFSGSSVCLEEGNRTVPEGRANNRAHWSVSRTGSCDTEVVSHFSLHCPPLKYTKTKRTWNDFIVPLYFLPHGPVVVLCSPSSGEIVKNESRSAWRHFMEPNCTKPASFSPLESLPMWGWLTSRNSGKWKPLAEKVTSWEIEM